MKKLVFLTFVLFFIMLMALNCSDDSNSRYTGTWNLTNVYFSPSGGDPVLSDLRFTCDDSGNFIFYYRTNSSENFTNFTRGKVSYSSGYMFMNVTDLWVNTNWYPNTMVIQAPEVLIGNMLGTTQFGSSGPPSFMMFKKSDTTSGWSGDWQLSALGTVYSSGYTEIQSMTIDMNVDDTNKVLTQIISNCQITNGILGHMSIQTQIAYYSYDSSTMTITITNVNGAVTNMPYQFRYNLLTDSSGRQHLCMPAWVKE